MKSQIRGELRRERADEWFLTVARQRDQHCQTCRNLGCNKLYQPASESYVRLPIQPPAHDDQKRLDRPDLDQTWAIDVHAGRLQGEAVMVFLLPILGMFLAVWFGHALAPSVPQSGLAMSGCLAGMLLARCLLRVAGKYRLSADTEQPINQTFIDSGDPDAGKIR